MSKLVYCIYFSKDGKLPESVYAGLHNWHKQLAGTPDIDLVFITNTQELDAEARKKLAETNVNVKDYTAYTEKSKFGTIIKDLFRLAEEKRLEKYTEEQTILLAVISDILRLAILFETEEYELTLYSDINDNTPDFEQFKKLNAETFKKHNPWGIAFPLWVTSQGTTIKSCLFNDTLIGCNTTEPALREKMASSYLDQVKRIAEIIGVLGEVSRTIISVSALPQPIGISPDLKTLTWNKITVPTTLIDSNKYLTVHTNLANGTTWLSGSSKAADRGTSLSEYLNKLSITDPLPNSCVPPTTTSAAGKPKFVAMSQ